MFTITSLGTLLSSALIRVVEALIIWFVGKYVIARILAAVDKTGALGKLDASVAGFARNGIRVLLYVILIVAIISVLGVPMASVITVLASAGVAVGMAMQGSLSNLAGGLMLMIFRPFSVGQYINAAGAEGVVKAINLFYTVLTTVDNKDITIPNGSLMNANVTNFSSEPTRRVDLTFGAAKGTDVELVTKTMLAVMQKNDKVLEDPEPFAKLSGGTNEAMEFTARAWCASADYWDVYFGLTKEITEALGAAGVQAPAARVITEAK
ncbi:MAG: mechanosensitive ion channel [Solobacterium sp.]|nr:mechanosensitive ion channel [Solobacterium sp.]